MKHRVLVTTPLISSRMSNTRSKRNRYENLVAKHLYHIGLRYRLNYRKLPGTPDIALTKYKVAVFIDGSFWHGKNWEQKKPKLKSNRDYWIEKIEENITRDLKNDKKLNEMGWRTIHLWDDDIKKDINGCIARIVNLICSSNL